MNNTTRCLIGLGKTVCDSIIYVEKYVNDSFNKDWWKYALTKFLILVYCDSCVRVIMADL